MSQVLSVNVGTVRPVEWAGLGRTAIDKRPVAGPVRAHALGLGGDEIGDLVHHGGADQALYAYAREDLDWWETELGRPIRDGQFGENLTTVGIDVNAALVGERWRVGEVLLEVASPRIPCNDFKNWQRTSGYDDRAWVRRFTATGLPGPYLRVLEEGRLQAGDVIAVVHRPDHGITLSEMFKVLTTEAHRMEILLRVDDLAERVRVRVERRLERVRRPAK